MTEVRVNFDPEPSHVTIRVPTFIKHRYLIDRIDTKVPKAAAASMAMGTVRLRYEDSDGDMVRIGTEKWVESLQHGKADMMQQIQYYERIVAQKDQQIDAMRQKGSSLQHQYKRLWDGTTSRLTPCDKKDLPYSISTKSCGTNATDILPKSTRK